MADLTPEEIKEGRWMLGGPRIVFWISLVIAVIVTIGSIVSFFTETFDFITSWSSTGSAWALMTSISGLIWAVVWLVLYWVELAAMSNGKPYAVGLGRFLIIWMMIFSFPVGTIIGAIIWRRFSHPVAQKYLNYN